jgi:putative hydrolase of HD superfamily
MTHSEPLEALLEALRLKALPRAGWVRKGVPGPESVASHSWGVAWLVLALLPRELDRGRALAYATLHDLPEVRIGDLTPLDRVPREEKQRREREAMGALAAQLGRADLAALFDDYEAQADPEARFVRELDRLDMALQALAHHLAGTAGMEEFIASADAVVRHPALRPWMEAIRARWSR